MDFKVAGTANGITALQMDIKIEGINEEIMDRALEQALAARLQILAEMNKVINTPRTAIAETAPRFTQIKIDPEKIRDLIGKGGATIRAITEATGAQIDIEDTGVVRVYAANMDAQTDTLRRIEAITAEAEIGAIYTGKVVRIVDFGAFVEFMPGKDGLVHISQICNERIAAVSDRLQEGQEVQVKVLDVDARGRIKLSIKDAMPEESSASVEV
jgi:polyribonucleotide nucleotidyltransferase